MLPIASNGPCLVNFRSEREINFGCSCGNDDSATSVLKKKDPRLPRGNCLPGKEAAFPGPVLVYAPIRYTPFHKDQSSRLKKYRIHEEGGRVRPRRANSPLSLYAHWIVGQIEWLLRFKRPSASSASHAPKCPPSIRNLLFKCALQPRRNAPTKKHGRGCGATETSWLILVAKVAQFSMAADRENGRNGVTGPMATW
jgi:hypothetical protein